MMHLIEICLFLAGCGLIAFVSHTIATIRGDIAPFELVFVLLGGGVLIAAAIGMFVFA